MFPATEIGATANALEGDAVEREFVRQYLDNGLAAYDAAGKRFGVVADYDRPGAGFVVRIGQPPAGLYIPMRFVRKVRRGKVYLSELAGNLLHQPLGRTPRPEARPNPLSLAFQRLIGRPPTEEP